MGGGCLAGGLAPSRPPLKRVINVVCRAGLVYLWDLHRRYSGGTALLFADLEGKLSARFCQPVRPEEGAAAVGVGGPLLPRLSLPAAPAAARGEGGSWEVSARCLFFTAGVLNALVARGFSRCV